MSHSTREKEVINLVMRQTDYTEEQAKEKLKKWNNNYINVIKEYLNPDFQTVKKKEKPKTLNQQMLGEIRSFMDDVYVQFENRKRHNQYINALNQLKESHENDNTKKSTSDDTNNDSSSENNIKIEEVV
jgi:hypothetical protein